MMNQEWGKKLLAAVLSNMLSNKTAEMTFDLDDIELRLPRLKEPIRLSGRVKINFVASKKNRK